jgi:hypothetical protein
VNATKQLPMMDPEQLQRFTAMMERAKAAGDAMARRGETLPNFSARGCGTFGKKMDCFPIFRAKITVLFCHFRIMAVG